MCQIPDDHEFTSNVDAVHLNSSSPFQRVEVALAGRRGFIEYQMQLHHDVFDDDGNVILHDDFAYFTRRVGSSAFVFLDTRYQRSFHFEDEYPYLGSKQWDMVKKAMETFGMDDSVKHIFVISSIPLMFTTSALADVAYWGEREKFSSYHEVSQSNINLLNLLAQYAHKTSIIAGDVHLFLHARLCPESEDQCLEQWVSSGVSPKSTIAETAVGFVFHSASIYGSSRVVDNWSFSPLQCNIGTNALFVEMDSSMERPQFQPVFEPNPTRVFKLKQYVFVDLGNSIAEVSPYIVLTGFISTLVMILVTPYIAWRLR